MGTNSSAVPGLEASWRLVKRPASLAFTQLACSRCDKSRGLGQSPRCQREPLRGLGCWFHGFLRRSDAAAEGTMADSEEAENWKDSDASQEFPEFPEWLLRVPGFSFCTK